MKKFTREELAKSAIPYFEKFSDKNTIIACEDGQLFEDNAKSKAALASHCAELKLTTFTIDRSEALALKTKAKAKVSAVDFSLMKHEELLAEALKLTLEGCSEMDEEELRAALEKHKQASVSTPEKVDYSKMLKPELIELATRKQLKFDPENVTVAKLKELLSEAE